jgi:hypothetical protein
MRVLVLYHAGFSYTPTIHHYLSSISRYSVFEVEYFNVDQKHDDKLDFSAYDALFINFCVISISRIEPPEFMAPLMAGLCRYEGLKIVSVQDEYDFTNTCKQFYLRIGVKAILTNVPQLGIKYIYPEPEFDNVQFCTVQTAYIADELLAINQADVLPLADRPIPLGYRGRNLPYRLGDLGWHKSEIGVRFKQACTQVRFACDIEVDEDKRFTGNEWLRFVRRCRVMLGTPSGANVFDFDGSLHRMMTERWNAQAEFTYLDVRDEINTYSVPFDMGQVSARIFEAAVQKTAMALIRGGYSGVLRPEEHYVPINPDYSNIYDVLHQINDVPAMQAMADRAYRYVVDNPRNRYSHMVAQLDGLIEEFRTTPGKGGVPSLKVTAQPLGADPYLFEKLCDLRQVLRDQIDKHMEFVDLVAQRRVEVFVHPDGTYRILKTPEAYPPPSEGEGLPLPGGVLDAVLAGFNG